MMTSAVLVAPADLRAATDAALSDIGFGPASFTVPLAARGRVPTHWGAHILLTPSLSRALAVARADGSLTGVIVSAPDLASININEDAPEALTVLPGVGRATAAAIVAGRPWPSIDALADLKGVTAADVAAWRSIGAYAVRDGASSGETPAVHFERVISGLGLRVVATC